MNYVSSAFLVLKKSIRGLKNVISGQFLVHFRWNSHQKFFLENFYSTKRFVFDFQGESLEQFLRYRAYVRRYEHFRGFWQSTASSFRTVKEEAFAMQYKWRN